MTRVLIVDDQGLVRAGFRSILERDPDIDVVGEAADGVEALDVLARMRDTALTRAEEHVRVIGSVEAFAAAVNRPAVRATGLRRRLSA